MLISPHKQAKTMLKIGAGIQANTEPSWMIVEHSGIFKQAI